MGARVSPHDALRRVPWASEVCWRVTEAGTDTGYRVGETWRSGDAGGAPRGFSAALAIRAYEGPLVVAARFYDPASHALWEVLHRVEPDPPLPAAVGEADFAGFGEADSLARRWPDDVAYVRASELLGHGDPRPLPGRVLATGAFWSAWSAVLVEEEGERWHVTTPLEAGAPLERRRLDVSAATRFLRAREPALFDPEAGEVIFLEPATFAVAERRGLPDGARDAVVRATGEGFEVFVRVGTAIHRQGPGGAFAPMPGLPPATRLLAQRGAFGGDAQPVFVEDGGLRFLSLDGSGFGELVPWTGEDGSAGLPGGLLGLSGPVAVAAGGFTFASPSGARGPTTYDTRARLGGPISHLSLDGAAWAVARPDGTHDLYRTPDRCPGE